MRATILATLAVFAFATPAALHVQQDAAGFPSTPPPAGTPRDFRVPEPKRITLDNGLEVAFVEWGTIPKVLVSLTVRTGNVFEKEKEIWLSDLTGNLMREGTQTRTSAQIAEEAARMGGSLTIGVGGDTTIVGGTVLSEYGPRMVDLLADVVQNPSFPESEIGRLKADLLRSPSPAASRSSSRSRSSRRCSTAITRTAASSRPRR
jgi:predicted Zn-dependent peptidase